MSGSVNKCIILGFLGRDPEIKSFPSGDKIANFSVATSRHWRDQNSGERKELTTWHNIAVRGEGLVKFVDNYVKRGSKVYIEGEINNRKWQDKDGNDRYTTEIVVSGFNGQLTLLDSKKEDSQDNEANRYGGETSYQSTTQGNNDLDDDIPFDEPRGN